MDIASITGALSGAVQSVGLAKAALGVRDFNAAALELAKLHEQLLGAQQQLLTQGATLLTLQAENRDLSEELRKLRDRIAEKGRYELVDLGGGQFVYRSVESQPVHYLCQGCFDAGAKSVLQWGSRWHCNRCKNAYGRTSGDAIMIVPRERWSDF